mmetsp:Transcript_26722/g.87643  ORF Transcript_26722/g.87643 Transcript_26722/m.87643 type:complete len:271 (-) Transcript_26722:782-1594(-)
MTWGWWWPLSVLLCAARALGAGGTDEAVKNVGSLGLLAGQGDSRLDDAPSQWKVKWSSEHAQVYFVDVLSRRAQWQPPASLLWHCTAASPPTAEEDPFSSLDAPERAFFVNLLTGQRTWVRPASLAWRRIRGVDGAPYYFNYATNTTAATLPPELGGWYGAPDTTCAGAVDRSRVNEYWSNVELGESSWAPPTERGWQRVPAPPAQIGSGQRIRRWYWLNFDTSEAQWTPPEEAAWLNSANGWFRNAVTGALRSRAPPQLAWTSTSITPE